MGQGSSNNWFCNSNTYIYIYINGWLRVQFDTGNARKTASATCGQPDLQEGSMQRVLREDTSYVFHTREQQASRR